MRYHVMKQVRFCILNWKKSKNIKKNISVVVLKYTEILHKIKEAGHIAERNDEGLEINSKQTAYKKSVWFVSIDKADRL